MTGHVDCIARWRLLRRPLKQLPRFGAVLVVMLLAAAMAWSSVAVPQLDRAADAQQLAKEQTNARAGIGDFELYTRIHARVDQGENYYAAALEQQRANNYPTRPFFTVRLPTLAMAHSVVGAEIVGYFAVGLLILLIAVYLSALQGKTRLFERVAGAILLFFGGAGVFAEQAPLIHELIAGLLLSFALVAYRPHSWWLSLLCVALALAFRELALPFALLWLAFAAIQRRWNEALAIIGVIGLFAAAMYAHSLAVQAHVLPGDGASAGWDALVGPALPLLSLARLTLLLVLPVWLAAPLALLPLIGWIGLGGRMALFAALWFVGFFAAMALFARAENFYWVMLVLPAYVAGFAFVPRALADLYSAIARPAFTSTAKRVN